MDVFDIMNIVITQNNNTKSYINHIFYNSDLANERKTQECYISCESLSTWVYKDYLIVCALTIYKKIKIYILHIL